MMTATLTKDLLKFLGTTTGIDPAVRSLKSPAHGCSAAEFADYPTSGLTTTVSLGLSLLGGSMWRGLALGYEIVVCVEAAAIDANDLLSALVQEERRRSRDRDRRRVVEANGVFAPGYAPHLLFTSDVTVTPDLLVRKKLGGQYVQFLQGVPIDDAELRHYDRSIPAFIEQLAASGRATSFPREA